MRTRVVVAVVAVLAAVGTGVPPAPADAAAPTRHLSAEGGYAVGVRPGSISALVEDGNVPGVSALVEGR